MWEEKQYQINSRIDMAYSSSQLVCCLCIKKAPGTSSDSPHSYPHLNLVPPPSSPSDLRTLSQVVPCLLPGLRSRRVLERALRVALQVAQRVLALLGWRLVGLGLALLVGVRRRRLSLLLALLALGVRRLAAGVGGGHCGSWR